MEIKNAQQKFMHGIMDIYDAEQQFLKGMEQMLANATDQNLKQMISLHMDQTRQQIRNLEQVFNIMGQTPQGVTCEGAQGLVKEAKRLMDDTKDAPALLNAAIAGAADKVEHYEIASYRGLVTDADLMGQHDIVSLLQQNLEQEESTSRLLEQSAPVLTQQAINAMGMGTSGGGYSEASPTC